MEADVLKNDVDGWDRPQVRRISALLVPESAPLDIESVG